MIIIAKNLFKKNTTMELDIQGFLNSLPISKYQRKILDEIITPIEPCATSSENYWKQRCEAAERVIEKFVVTPLHKDVTYWGKELFKDWQELKSTPSPTGDRDCEELKKEVERLKGLLEKNIKDDWHDFEPSFIQDMWEIYKTENNL